jgi:hypothetical protein
MPDVLQLELKVYSFLLYHLNTGLFILCLFQTSIPPCLREFPHKNRGNLYHKSQIVYDSLTTVVQILFLVLGI